MYNEQHYNGRGHLIPVSDRSRSGGALARETGEDEYVLSLSEMFRVVWRRLFVVILPALLLAGAAVGYSLAFQEPTYESSTILLVGQAQASEESRSSLSGEVEGLQRLTKTVAAAAGTRRVATAVIQDLNLPVDPGDFLKNVSAEQVPETQFVEVSYTDASPERAQLVVTAIGDELSRQVTEVSPSANSITATVWEAAVVPEDPASPKPIRNALLGLALGAMLGVGLAFLLEHLDDSWRSPEEVERVSGVPNFGVVPRFKVSRSGPLGGKGEERL